MFIKKIFVFSILNKVIGFPNKFNTNHYYQVNHYEPYQTKQFIKIHDKPYVMYRYNSSYHALDDACPHQGASLSQGWVNHRGNLHCPYHAFEFNKEGQFCGIPNPNKKFKSVPTKRHYIDKYPTLHFGNDIYLCPNPTRNMTESLLLPHYPPEHFNEEFIKIQDSIIIHQNYKVVTENVLDMLHISYIHSFGNKKFPLPFDVSFEQLSPTSGRSIFKYKPYELTISNQIGKSPVVIVENEFHLPTTTITRVIAGNVVKTVLTRSTPISENKSRFFYSVYRNFWYNKHFPIVNRIGDIVMKFLMKLTLKEDINILKHVYPEHRVGSLSTKYDVTILKYREALGESSGDK